MIQLFSSTETGAPIFNGTAGTLINVLDACLVNGFGGRTSLGWTKAFSGVNLAAYQLGGGSNRYLRVDDTVGQTARVRGFTTMSDVNTGTNPFPTDAQVAGGGWHAKTNNFTLASPRDWLLVGNETYFFFHNFMPLKTATHNWSNFFFGDINAFGGVGNTLLIANNNSSINGISNVSQSNNSMSTSGTSVAHWMASPYAGGASINVGKHWAPYKLGSISGGLSNTVFLVPDRITGGVVLSPFWIHEASTRILRGTLPGALASQSYAPLVHATKIVAPTGSGDITGNKYIYLDTTDSFGQHSGFFAEYDFDGTEAPGIGNFLMFMPFG